jgi:hypothetical protein
VALVVVAAVAFVLGGVALGGGTTASGPGPVATLAARAWLAARPFAPATVGVPASLGRQGALTGATLQPLGQWHHGAQAGETFAVTAGSSTYGLTVVTTGGRLAFPPTAGPVPFIVGQRPPAPPATLPGPAGLPEPVRAWSLTTFGPKGPGLAATGLGLAHDPTVVASWSPAEGGVVYRVTVPLSSLAPGTTAGDYATTYQALVARVAADASANSAAQATNAQAQAASQAAFSDNNAANPPNPALQAAAAAQASAAAAALQRAQAAAAAFTAAQATLTSSPKPATTATTAVATFDVWMRARSVVGWEPAGYGIGS